MPLVLLLHGCRQGSVDFAEESGFTRAADAEGFVVAAPRQEVRHQFGRCWRWYDSGHQQRDLGEPALLAGIVTECSARTRISASIGAGCTPPDCPPAARWR